MTKVWYSLKERLHNSDEGRAQQWCWQAVGLLAYPCSSIFGHLPWAVSSIRLSGYSYYQLFQIQDLVRLWDMWKISGEACCTIKHEASRRRRLWYENLDQNVFAQNNIRCTLHSMCLASLWEINAHQRSHHWAFEKQRRPVLGTLDSRGKRSRISFKSKRDGTDPCRLILSSLVLPGRTIHSMKPGPCSGSNTQAKIEWGCEK